jgi:1-acyl-sn-glycerol-3-phosphate acyltransferase
MSAPSSNISPFYRFARATANWFFNTFYDYSTSGSAHVPLEKSSILAANHTSFYDPPIISLHVRRQLNYFARDTLFKGLLGKIIRNLDTIPVTRNSADIKSLKIIFRVLKNNGAIVIFPEGTRSPDGNLSSAKPGAGMIACKSQATVVPTRIFGTFEIWGRQKKLPSLGGSIHICFGPPLAISEIDPGQDHPDRYGEASRRIMNAIAKLKAPEPVVI